MCELFLQVSGIGGLAVAVKIDRNSLIPSKWAVVARCQVCNGILQRSAVPTGARVHPNPVTYPDSTHFPITGGGKAIHTQTGCCHCGIYMFGWLREAVHQGGWGWSCAWLGKRYETRSCFFTVGLVSFRGPAGDVETRTQRTHSNSFCYLYLKIKLQFFSFCPFLIFNTSFGTYLYLDLHDTDEFVRQIHWQNIGLRS